MTLDFHFFSENRLRKTEVGEVPEEWDLVRIRDCGEVITGTTPSPKIKEYWNGAYPFVTPVDISEQKYALTTKRTVTTQGAEQGRLVPKDSVLVVCIGATIGKAALAYRDCITNQQINAIHCREGFNPEYVYYFVRFRENDLRNWAGSAAKAIIKKSQFEEFLLAVPRDPREQQRIVSVISTIDEVINKTAEVLALEQKLKRGLTLSLLRKTTGQSSVNFNDASAGISSEWPLKIVSDLFTVETGTTPSTRQERYWNFGDTLWVTPVDLSKLEGRTYLESTERMVTKDAVEDYNLAVAPKGSVILSTRAPVGLGAVLLRDATFNQGCKALIPKRQDEVVPEFYYYYLTARRKFLENLSSGATFTELSKDWLERFRVPHPNKKEQQEVVSILSSIEEDMEKERRIQKQAIRAKIWFTRNLLLGRVRAKRVAAN